MDQDTLVARVAARLNIDADDPLYTSLPDLVDEAITDLDSATPDGWPWNRSTLTTTISTHVTTFSTLSSTSTISKILTVKIENSTYGWEPLVLRSQDELDQIYPDFDEGAGIPESWYVEGEKLYVYPTPGQEYSAQVRVVTTGPALGEGSSTPVIPAVFHTAIIDQALLFAYQSLLDDDRVALQERRVARHIQKMRQYGMQYDPPPKIRVREWL